MAGKVGGSGGSLLAHGAGLAAGGSPLGFAASFHVAAAFFTGKVISTKS